MLIRSSVLILLLGISGGKCEKSKWDSGVRLLTKLHDDCQNLGIVSCFKIKAISFFDRADLRKEITLNDQLSIVRDDESRTERKIYAENELEKAFPRGNESELNEILIGKILDFFNGHKIVFRLPKIRPEEIREQIFEGRGKTKKLMAMMMLGMAMKKLAALPMMMGALYLIAGKSLFISKLAMALTMMMAVGKMNFFFK